MSVSRWAVVVLGAALLWTPTEAAAQERPDSVKLAELERRMDAMTRELEQLRLGREVVQADTSILGLGPAASKVYKVGQGVSLGGYGEILYENYSGERQDGSPASARDQVDALRAILYVGYKFNDRLLFNSEIEIEHVDEIFLEFAYVDYLLNDHVGLRTGLLLAPMGIVNELHEPPTFLGTERAVTENAIIPTTWRENGIGLFGGVGDFAWRGYVMNGLDGAGFSGSGLRGGRQKGARALAEDFGVAARLDYQGILGLLAGGSVYYGQSGQNAELDGQEVDAGTLIWDGHLDYNVGALDLRALVAGAHVNDARELSALNGLTGANGIAESMLGWYVQAGYDVLRGTDLADQLTPFVRYEQVNTQRSVLEGFAANPANDRTILTVGASWKPISNVVWKTDYQIHSNEADLGTNQFNMALGWIF
ncbi:MAG: hypothetical protein WEB88_01030 [Gemmatimonadota bacterium]